MAAHHTIATCQQTQTPAQAAARVTSVVAMIECTNCGAQGEANFSTNYFGELVCELCGTQSFLQSRNETQDMEDTNLDVTKASTMKRASTRKKPRRSTNGADADSAELRDTSGRNGTMQRGIGKRMKRRGANATLLNCIRATQTILDHQARALAAIGGFPDEYVSVVEQLWFAFLETWDRTSTRPLLRCFTEFFVPRDSADRAMDPAVTQQLLEQWDANRAAEAEAAAAAALKTDEGDATDEDAANGTVSDGPSDENDDAPAAAPAAPARTRAAAKRSRPQRRLPHPGSKRPAPTAPRPKKNMRLVHYSATLEQFGLLDLLGLLVLAARVLNLGVLPCDIAHYVQTGALPYHNLLAVCSRELQVAVYDVSLFFESTVSGNRVTASRVAYHAHYLQHHMALQLPPLNVSLAAYTMCANLGLPPHVFRHVQWLTARMNVKGAIPEAPMLLRHRRDLLKESAAAPHGTKRLDAELFNSSVTIAAHVAVAIKMTANWHEWIYARPHERVTRPVPPSSARDARSLPRYALEAFVDMCEDVLVGVDRANVPPTFESHVYDLRGKYSDVSHASDSTAVVTLERHPVMAYPPQYVNGVCDELDDEIDARVAFLQQQQQARDAEAGALDTGDDSEDVFFYPFYTTVRKFPVLHAAYEHVLALVSEYIDAPIASVLSVTEQLDREVKAACRVYEQRAVRSTPRPATSPSGPTTDL